MDVNGVMVYDWLPAQVAVTALIRMERFGDHTAGLVAAFRPFVREANGQF
jgi:hypothetical protein